MNISKNPFCSNMKIKHDNKPAWVTLKAQMSIA